ncbi:MAG: response regulator [Candidatus Cloacimonadota bacterium]|nr:response regulator [Candidatus Cloacimonadota bacterium]
MQNNFGKILIVDDSKINIVILTHMFDDENLSYELAMNGETALELLDSESFDLILLDIVMPKMDGFEVCKRVKSNPKTKNIPILFLTAKDATKDIVKGLEMGAADYLTRPYNPIELIARVKSQLKLRKADKALRRLIREKELLFREAHHRIKNNFTIISAILSMQSEQISDENSKSVLNNSRDRVLTMARLHEKLYSSATQDSINMKYYFSKIINDLNKGYNIEKKGIKIVEKIDEISIPSKLATSCGLLLNEIFTNAYKYGFPNGEKGKIEVDFHENSESEIVLRIFNDGVPISENINVLHEGDTLGMNMIGMLVQQIDGKITINNENGTEFKITFEKF